MHGLQTHHVCLDNFDSVLLPFFQSRPDQLKTIWGDGMVNGLGESSIGLDGIGMVSMVANHCNWPLYQTALMVGKQPLHNMYFVQYIFPRNRTSSDLS